MQLNTARSLALGREIHDAFGSWQKAREAACYHNGVHVISRAQLEVARKRRTAGA